MRLPTLLLLLVTSFVAVARAAVPGAAGELDQARQASPQALWDALDLYRRGDFDAAVSRAVRLGFDPAQAERWIARGPSGERDARRVAAAVCALDLASVRPFLLPRLVPWARAQLAQGEPGQVEALWLRTSIALAEGFGLWTFLLEDARPPMPAAVSTGRAPSPTPPAPIAHLRFARERLGEDPFVAMAEVVGAEFVTSPAVVGSASRIKSRAPGDDRLGADEPDRAAIAAAGAGPLLEAAAVAAQRLSLAGPLSPEALVRHGYLRLRLGDYDEALRSFDRVRDRTSHADLLYLARLYTGLTLDRLNRAEEAAAAYRAALDIVPGARSATTLLTTLLVRVGKLEEGEQLATSFLEAPREPDDPWRDYFRGDYPNARELIGRLRQAVK